ncbi:MAG TPA: 50S ribosomal protein L18 [Candidatus Paceibacterota bacterium]
MKRQVRRRRIRAKVFGTHTMPRLSIFKSNKYISAQIIDDEKGTTLVFSHGMKIKGKGKTAQAVGVGKNIAEKAKDKKITKVVFDRGGYIYTGLVKALADAARESGLKF